MTQELPRTRVRSSSGGARLLPTVQTLWEPLAKQAVVAALVVVAGGQRSVPWLLVTDAARMWQGVALALVLVVVTVLMARWPALRRAEIVIPLGDFIAIGLLRYGTGDNQSV
ncbi:hypothetical protein HR12_44985, partial [Microbacterium sp. SUBG005]